jgi:aerobic-type carbon monoxide dehydrogenase small subunit (CoxS/CutS family)
MNLSRREFLRNAGLAIGATAVASVSLSTSCTEASTLTSTDKPRTTAITQPPSQDVLPASDIVTLTVNGREYAVAVKPDWTLDFVLRDKLGLFGTKVGCGMGDCGSCTILVKGVAVLSCLMLAIECQGLDIETIEGLSDGIELHPIQQKFYDMEAFQCGFCTPGFIMAAKGLYNANPHPSMEDVRQSLSGHICTCGNFTRTVQAVTAGAA